MKNFSIFKFQIFSFFFSILLGTILHFTYELFNSNLFIASFSSVNESVWEHLKLAFFPMLLTTLVGLFFFNKNISNYICSKTFGIIVAISFITIFFYTYTGISGKNFAILDISSFFVAILLGEYIAYKKIISNYSCNTSITKIILLVLTCCFIIFTYYTPQISYFKDPLTGLYGINTIQK